MATVGIATILTTALSLASPRMWGAPATAGSRHLCRTYVSKKIPPRRAGILRKIEKDLSSLSPGKPSLTVIDFSLASPAGAAAIFKRMLATASKIGDDGLFTQWRISPDGRVSPILDDPTVAKDIGMDQIGAWNRDPDIRRHFADAHARSRELETALRQSITETAIGISEVVFSLQIRKPSEDWHLDWYPSEYLVATQTVVAKTRDGTGLHDEPFAGTEYLLPTNGANEEISDRLSTATLDLGPIVHAGFTVHEAVTTDIVATGRSATAATGSLAIHSGVTRVERVLGRNQRFGLVSPPHRGSQKNLEFRGAILVRLAPVGRNQPKSENGRP